MILHRALRTRPRRNRRDAARPGPARCPRLRAARRLDQIAAYGAAGRLRRAVSRRRRMPCMLRESPAGSARSSRAWSGRREDDLRRELMAAGIYRLSPTALLGYRALATVLLPALALLAAPEAGRVRCASASWLSAAGAAGRSRSCCCSGGHGSACSDIDYAAAGHDRPARGDRRGGARLQQRAEGRRREAARARSATSCA